MAVLLPSRVSRPNTPFNQLYLRMLVAFLQLNNFHFSAFTGSACGQIMLYIKGKRYLLDTNVK